MISALVKAVGWDALECEYSGVRPPAASRVIEHLAPPVCLLVVVDNIALN